MAVGPEWTLIALAAGLYLYDSARLLYYNEGVLVSRRGGWLVKFGWRAFRIRGKEIFLPHPLFPHRATFRLPWSVEAAGGASTRDWAALARRFRPLVAFVWGMATALFVLLPLGLFSRLGEKMILAAAVILYLNIAAALVWIALHRAELELSRRRLAALAFESLVCSPFALNLVRKISSEMALSDDLMAAARGLQGERDWSATRAQFIARIDEELEAEDEESERASKLRRYRGQLQDEAVACLPPKSS